MLWKKQVILPQIKNPFLRLTYCTSFFNNPGTLEAWGLGVAAAAPNKFEKLYFHMLKNHFSRKRMVPPLPRNSSIASLNMNLLPMGLQSCWERERERERERTSYSPPDKYILILFNVFVYEFFKWNCIISLSRYQTFDIYSVMSSWQNLILVSWYRF